MADLTKRRISSDSTGLGSTAYDEKIKDMGDGTHALVVYAGGTGTSSGQVQGTAAGNAAAAGNPVQVGGIYESTPSTYDNNDAVPLHTDTRGNLKITIFNADGTTGASVGAINADALAATANSLGVRSFGYVFNGTTFDRARGDTNGSYTVTKPVTSGGLSAARVVTDTTGVIKASAGQLYKLHSVRNANAAVRYLHLYDKATAPTLSTDTPVLTISLAASSVQNEIDIGGDIGVAFANGIAWAYTTDNVAIPTTAGTSTELMFSGAYK